VGQNKESKDNIFEILNLRSEWESCARGLNTDLDSSTKGLSCFVEHSYKNNRFKNGWEEAMEIAESILGYSK